MLTISSANGRHRAVVSETNDGIAIAFYRLVDDDPSTAWRYVRTAMIPQPFHVALAHSIVEIRK